MQPEIVQSKGIGLNDGFLQQYITQGEHKWNRKIAYNNIVDKLTIVNLLRTERQKFNA